MGAGTRKDQIESTRARLVLAYEYLKESPNPDRQKIARGRIDQLLDELHRLLRA